MMECWHPERMSTALSGLPRRGHCRLVEILKRSVYFWMRSVPVQLKTFCFNLNGRLGMVQKALITFFFEKWEIHLEQ